MTAQTLPPEMLREVKNKMKRHMYGRCIFLAAAMICAFSGIAAAKEDDPVETHVVILGTSDIHGNICCWSYDEDKETDCGMARVYTYIQETREENPVTFLIDGGDELQGNLLTELAASEDPDSPHPVVAAMNYMGYDSMTLGNHDFDWGVADMQKMFGTAQFSLLGQNVLDERGELLTGKGWTILERGGIRLAVIGVVTPNVPRLDGSGGGIGDLTFEDAPEAVKRAITEIGDQADIIMVSAHMGMTGEFDEAGGGDCAQKILDENPEIDVLQVGHYHITVDQRQGHTVIGGVKNAGREIARFDLTLDEDKNIIDSEVSIISMKEYLPDREICDIPAVRKAHEAAILLAESETGEETGDRTGDGTSLPVGSTTARFQPDNEIRGIPQGRLEDTPLIDLILKVQLINSGADVTSAALFRDNCDLPEGDIYYSDINDIYEYNNTLCRLTVTGKELKDYMEWSASYYNQWKEGDINISFDPDIPGSSYDMFAGVDYEINLSKPEGERIENVMFHGAPLEDDRTLTLAVTNYRYSSTIKAENLAAGEKEWESSVYIRDMIVQYFEENSPIEPETDGNWRITGADLQEDDPRREELIRAINDGLLEVPYNKSCSIEDYGILMDQVRQESTEPAA